MSHFLRDYDDSILTELVERRYKELVELGQFIPGVSDTIDPDQPPIWYDSERFKKAQKVANQFYISLHISHLAGLLLVLQLPRGLIPLLANGNHASIPKLFKRYVSTQQHVKSWYEEDIYDPNKKAYKSVRQVRAMHQAVCKLMNGKTNRVIGRDNIWVSQFDMALTQWAFIGLLVLYPQEYGMHPASVDDIESLIYFWRVIGYVMGIEDRFNLCNGDYKETYVYFKLVLDRVYKPVCSQVPHPVPTGVEITKGVVRSLRVFNYSIRWPVLMKYWYKVLDIPVKIEITGRRNRLRYKILKFSMGSFLKSSSGHFIYRTIFKTNQRIQNSRRQTVERKLKQRFPDAPYEKCPYGFDLDKLESQTV